MPAYACSGPHVATSVTVRIPDGGSAGVAQLEQRVVSSIEGLNVRHRREVRVGGTAARPHSLAPHASVATLQTRRQQVALAGLQRYEGAHVVRLSTLAMTPCMHTVVAAHIRDHQHASPV